MKKLIIKIGDDYFGQDASYIINSFLYINNNVRFNIYGTIKL